MQVWFLQLDPNLSEAIAFPFASSSLVFGSFRLRTLGNRIFFRTLRYCCVRLCRSLTADAIRILPCGLFTADRMGNPAEDAPPLDEEGRPCRSCTDFKTWMKFSRKGGTEKKQNRQTVHTTQRETSSQPSTDSVEPTSPSRADCPVDKDQLGQATWSFLHTMAAHFPETPTENQRNDINTFMQIFSHYYPCWYCAKDLRDDMKQDPPDTNSRSALSQWMCRIHNRVNKKLGKPLFDCSRVDERWRTGWRDGSCDE